ncbi:hypothetical protein CONCODRAFT_10287 [Conidiobolus coronatus NRRL 28638]|uniref:G-protein coupled receptors family 1 profile domain-containing protein n=1 Tax=Conidiobolus coronatus (strain ATCC 28846 / CBS 209.66 / NRRL 28638) TaxID=796925 RepID=A0A137NY73_CONC2|nr:hypothetical protein CONCODRAFT_10287 [Conidiobolus coronatus NRRL 28638]|eukprot:KXN67628.1 hypothetical protein CONCODRAFT_10287 [Conidiobolus coronatus NRRL 28638]
MKRPTNQEVYDQIWPNPWPLPIFYLISGLIGLVLGGAILHVVLKHFRKNMHIDMKLGLCLVVLDVLSSIDFIFSSIANLPVFQLYVHYPVACMVQVAWASTTFITSMNLIGIIALERCLLIVYNIRLKDKHYWYMVFVAYIIPLFNAILCIATDSVEFQNFGVVCHYSAHTLYGIIAFLIMMLFKEPKYIGSRLNSGWTLIK